MIKLEKTDVYGWEAAIRGMRNPMNSWDKSDTDFSLSGMQSMSGILVPAVGENDLKLMKSLAKAGSDHSKFLRMINVTVDITAPLYWWKEYDTYKVGTVAISCSTMHKIHEKEFVIEDFSTDTISQMDSPFYENVLKAVIDGLNEARNRFLETKEKCYWRAMIELLPTSYNQKRTVQLNYQVLKSMYHARKNHKLDEWRDFCKWIEGLPYFKEICIGGEAEG